MIFGPKKGFFDLVLAARKSFEKKAELRKFFGEKRKKTRFWPILRAAIEGHCPS